MSKLTVQEMTLNDIDSISKIRQSAWLETYTSEENEISLELINDYFAYRRKKQNKQEHINKIKDSISDANKYFKVAKDGQGQVVGFIFGEKTANNRAILGSLYLKPRLIGKGNGRLLMDGFVKWLGKGLECELFVVSYNNRAINFYKKYGFVIESHEPTQEAHLDATHPLISKMPVIKMVRKAELFNEN